MTLNYIIQSKCHGKQWKKAATTYKSLILHRVTDTACKQPKWPEILKTKVKDEVSHQDKHPHTEELDVGKCAIHNKTNNVISVNYV